MLFETLLCILLHLTVIFSPGRYSTQEIANYEIQNQAAIDAIHADPVLEQSIVTQYSPQVPLLDIYDGSAED